MCPTKKRASFLKPALSGIFLSIISAYSLIVFFLKSNHL